uniref:Peptidase_M24 domain-containing protein n=1 Tax=Meloidogyne hapla TaxID=6305 RepID=A0A1I8B451_MELHA
MTTKLKTKQRDVSSDSSKSGSSKNDSSIGDVKDTSPASDKVFNKYGMAAEVVNTILKEIIGELKVDAEVGQLCSRGDARILELTSNLFKREKNVQKGIAMPTCISIDNCVCHFSPLRSEAPVLLKEGQVVKVDLGAHVDGYIATAAHTVVIGATRDNKVTGKKANVIVSAYNIMEMVLRMLKPEKNFKNIEVSEKMGKLAKVYETTPIENMLSHQVERFKSVGDKQIIQNPSDEQKTKMEKCTFETFEVYTVDILISTGEGKSKTLDARTTIFKKTDDMVYNLKLKASRAFFHEAQQKFGSMPFSIRDFEDEKVAKVGSTECAKHDLMQPYPVLYEKEGDYVAQFKCTAIIMPNGIYKITGIPLDNALLKCDLKIDNNEFLALLNEPLKPKKKKGGGGEKEKEIVKEIENNLKEDKKIEENPILAKEKSKEENKTKKEEKKDKEKTENKTTPKKKNVENKKKKEG